MAAAAKAARPGDADDIEPTGTTVADTTVAGDVTVAAGRPAARRALLMEACVSCDAMVLATALLLAATVTLTCMPVPARSRRRPAAWTERPTEPAPAAVRPAATAIWARRRCCATASNWARVVLSTRDRRTL